MKITIERLRKIAKAIPPDTKMQPFYEQDRPPTPLECVLWFATYCQNIIENKPDRALCPFCGQEFATVPIMSLHYLLHYPKRKGVIENMDDQNKNDKVETPATPAEGDTNPPTNPSEPVDGEQPETPAQDKEEEDKPAA